VNPGRHETIVQYEDRQYESERLQHVAKKRNDRENRTTHSERSPKGRNEHQDGDARKQRGGNLRKIAASRGGWV